MLIKQTYKSSFIMLTTQMKKTFHVYYTTDCIDQ